MGIPVEKLQQILDQSVSCGEECGLQLAIYQNGKLEANLCAGYTDESRNTHVTTDSLFPLFSSGKAVMATAFHILKEEYGFDYSELVCQYWKEFTGNSKEITEINHILSHRSGLHILQASTNTSDELADWNSMCSKICNAVPAWTPGTKCGYQSISFAWLLGELAYKISGIPFKKYIEDKILTPLQINDTFFFGTTDNAEKRVVDLDTSAFEEEHTFTGDFHRNKNLRQAFIPSANGIATAESAARIFNALYHLPLLQKETLENATVLNRHPDDPITKSWTKFGLGYALPDWENSGGDIFGHGGAAGAELFYCKSQDMAVCFVKNRPLPTHPLHPIRDRIADALELPRLVW